MYPFQNYPGLGGCFIMQFQRVSISPLTPPPPPIPLQKAIGKKLYDKNWNFLGGAKQTGGEYRKFLELHIILGSKTASQSLAHICYCVCNCHIQKFSGYLLSLRNWRFVQFSPRKFSNSGKLQKNSLTCADIPPWEQKPKEYKSIILLG